MKLIIEARPNCLPGLFDANILPLGVHNISSEVDKNSSIGSLKNPRWRSKLRSLEWMTYGR